MPRHDLSHPARTKKQIDASSHYNSLPPLPSLHRAMLYPPGIARQIKHHLLSERVDLDLTAPSTPGECVDDQDDFFVHKGRAPCASIFAEYLFSDNEDERAMIQGRENFAKDPKVLGFTRPCVTVCARAILHTIAWTGLKISDGFMHAFTLESETLMTSSCNKSLNTHLDSLAIYKIKETDFI